MEKKHSQPPRCLARSATLYSLRMSKARFACSHNSGAAQPNALERMQLAVCCWVYP